jgi:energy-coupling factor transporter transmembrane protein EcfT
LADVRPASSLDPACRLLCLALISSAALFAPLAAALTLAMALAALLALEGQTPLRILSEATFLLPFVAFAAILEAVVVGPGFSVSLSVPVDAALLGARLLAGYLGGRLYYASTSVSETRDAATRIARRLPGLSRADLGFAFSLIMGFVPLIIEEWKASLEAARSRAYGRSSGIRGAGLFVAAYLRRLMLRAVAVPEALIARGWTGERGIERSAWRARDYLAAMCCAALLVLFALQSV